MAKICFPDNLGIPDQLGMVRDITKGVKQWPYVIKITIDSLPTGSKNMYIGLEDHDLATIIWHLKELKLLKEG